MAGVNYASYPEVVRELPNATFEGATDAVGFSRYVKGDEEIACLRHAAAIAEEGCALSPGWHIACLHDLGP